MWIKEGLKIVKKEEYKEVCRCDNCNKQLSENSNELEVERNVPYPQDGGHRPYHFCNEECLKQFLIKGGEISEWGFYAENKTQGDSK
jgi:uncharacterized protein with PIN domain